MAVSVQRRGALEREPPHNGGCVTVFAEIPRKKSARNARGIRIVIDDSFPIKPSETIPVKPLIRLTVFVLQMSGAVTCQAVTIVEGDHSLKITGDRGNDDIEIVDSGAGSLTVNDTEYVEILRLEIDTKGGQDHVTYDTVEGLSLSSIQIDLGPGDDVAELNLGIVGADVRSEVHGGAGKDEITTVFGEVLAGVNAESVMEGELGDDMLTCLQQNVAGSVSCVGRGGAGNDQIFCHAENVLEGGQAGCLSDGGIGDDMIACAKSYVAGSVSCISDGGAGDDQIFCHADNVLEGGRAECTSNGGIGNDTILCTKVDIAGFASCVSDGGAGNDSLSCMLDVLTGTGSGLCHQTGGTGNDTLLCETNDIDGEHVCYADGGAGNDLVTSIVKGVNRPDVECNLYGGTGNDELVEQLGTLTEPLTVQSGTVTFLADAGAGDDHFFVTANLTDESDATITDVTVLMGTGNDTATLNYYSLGGAALEDQLYDGGKGVDTYEGTVPAMYLPLVNFEIGV